MNLNHRIIAMVGKDVKRVHCLTCGSDHKYYPPKGEAEKEKYQRPEKVFAAKPKTRDGASRIPARASGEWTTVMREMSADAVPRQYRMHDSYESGEFIQHPTFGAGRVLGVVGMEKIEVIFEAGKKVLICNKEQR
ncbi:MAG: hypothetical protein V2B18_07860 [Pseudomonadota bacterium]